MRRYANQALAESAPGEQIATVIDHEQSLALDLQEAVVTGATLQVYL